jgi:uncharacterized membrane protein YdfJ with MMPL/SSD domain
MEDALILCGFNAATARYLMGQGFVTPEELLLATEADLDTIARNVARSPHVSMVEEEPSPCHSLP